MIRSRLPLFHTDGAGRIVEWNRAAEEFSGIPARDAVGYRCWEVIRGRDARGGIACHPGCSVVRLAREGWPVSCTDVRVRMPSGVERLALETIVVGVGEEAGVLHLMQAVAPDTEAAAPSADAPVLTPRQREILGLLADGIRPKEIARRLSLSLPTVRNHIHALLRRLGVSSQLAAVAKARDLDLLHRPSGEHPRQR